MSERNNPENYDKLWEITLSNKDYSKVIKYVNVTNFEYNFKSELEIHCIRLNEACKPKKVWSLGWYHYNKDEIGDICNIDIQEQSEVEETYKTKTILINR